MSPEEAQATGEREGCRQRLQDAKGRKESRVRRVDCDPQLLLSWERSWVVKKAREVLRLPGGELIIGGLEGEGTGRLTVCHLVGVVCGVVTCETLRWWPRRC